LIINNVQVLGMHFGFCYVPRGRYHNDVVNLESPPIICHFPSAIVQRWWSADTKIAADRINL